MKCYLYVINKITNTSLNILSWNYYH